MGLSMYFTGEKELSPKSRNECKLINKLNNYPFTHQQKEELTKNYLYISVWSNNVLYSLVNERKFTGQIGDINGLKKYTNKLGHHVWTIKTEAWNLRYANAIHKWFVDHAQDGLDDCGYYPINNVLDAFIEQSGKVLNGIEQPDKDIPTQSGFFFGDTAYDNWYYKQLRSTRNRLKQFTSKSRKDKWKYFYQSSW